MKLKKKIIGLTAFVLSTVVGLFGCSGCSSSQLKAEGFRLSYFDGMNVEEYDTSLLWRNTSEVANDGSGDGDVFYVSEEEDGVYGGYFYMYSTKRGGVPSTEDGLTPTPENGTAAYYGYVLTSRSKDMVDWEMCGAVDNCYSLKLSMDTWVLGNMYAPEVIRNPKDSKYYMYYTARSKVNNDELRAMGAKYSSSTSGDDRFYIGVAVSDSRS